MGNFSSCLQNNMTRQLRKPNVKINENFDDLGFTFITPKCPTTTAVYQPIIRGNQFVLPALIEALTFIPGFKRLSSEFSKSPSA